MAKRSSSRRRRKTKKQKQLSAADLLNKGTTAFKQEDYGTAIRFWGQLQKRSTAPPELPKLLAEAYFRQGLSQTPIMTAPLIEAHKLQPHVPIYRYHLALAYHREGDLEQAEPHYRHLLEKDDFGRAAMPLAQLLVMQKNAVSKDSVWSRLTPAEQQEITAAHALITKRADSTIERLADDGDSLHPLWHGLFAFRLQDWSAVKAHLTEAIASTEGTVSAGVSYVLGLMALQQEKLEQAEQYWEKIDYDTFKSYAFKRNMALLHYQQAIASLQEGNAQQAMALLDKIPNSVQLDKSYDAFSENLYWSRAYQASQQNDWGIALKLWQTLAQKFTKPPRRLIFNLALAHQKTDDYFEAAERWREVLRRRPRKADHPDALDDDQVARIWQNVAENYSHYGDYEEAIKTYKNAVKWAPDNLELRLKLVEAYQTEGRWQASENELNRILEKDPDNVPALTLLAESYAGNGWWGSGRAKEIWQRILKIEPQNPVAQQQLVDLYLQDGLWHLRFGDAKGAIREYEKGLAEFPNNIHLTIMLGSAYLDLKQYDKARECFDQALALKPENFNTLRALYLLWMEEDSVKDMAVLQEKLFALPPSSTPFELYIDIAEHCLDNEYTVQAEQFFSHITTAYADNNQAIISAANAYRRIDEDGKALQLLKQVLKRDPKNASASLHLGILYCEQGQKRIGKRYFRDAERFAQEANNKELLYEIQMAKDYFVHGKRQPSNPLQMLSQLPPELLEQYMKSAPPEIQQLYKMHGPKIFEMLMDMYDEEDFYG